VSFLASYRPRLEFRRVQELTTECFDSFSSATFAPSASTGVSGSTIATSIPTVLPQGEPNGYRPSALSDGTSSAALSPAQTAGSSTSSKTSSSPVVPIVVSVVGALVLGGAVAFLVFWMKRKKRNGRSAPAQDGDEAPYVVDLMGGGGLGSGMGENGRETTQVQPWNYSPASGSELLGFARAAFAFERLRLTVLLLPSPLQSLSRPLPPRELGATPTFSKLLRVTTS